MISFPIVRASSVQLLIALFPNGLGPFLDAAHSVRMSASLVELNAKSQLDAPVMSGLWILMDAVLNVQLGTVSVSNALCLLVAIAISG